MVKIDSCSRSSREEAVAVFAPHQVLGLTGEVAVHGGVPPALGDGERVTAAVEDAGEPRGLSTEELVRVLPSAVPFDEVTRHCYQYFVRAGKGRVANMSVIRQGAAASGIGHSQPWFSPLLFPEQMYVGVDGGEGGVQQYQKGRTR